MNVVSKFRLDEKVAIVTGGGRGIGRAIALHFAHMGADVVVAELDRISGRAVEQEIQALGRRSLFVMSDVTQSGQIAELVETATNEFGRIDILVNNVGAIPPLMPVVNISDDEWDRLIRLNLTSTFLCSKGIGRVMIARGKGNIVNIASASGTRPAPGMSAYAAAKAGVINFTETLSIELARYHIRVNCVVPGPIETESGAASRGSAKERVERAGIPLGRIGRPEDVALAAIYLASDASDYVTGTCIVVNGGPHTRKGDTELFIDRFPEL